MEVIKEILPVWVAVWQQDRIYSTWKWERCKTVVVVAVPPRWSGISPAGQGIAVSRPWTGWGKGLLTVWLWKETGRCWGMSDLVVNVCSFPCQAEPSSFPSEALSSLTWLYEKFWLQIKPQVSVFVCSGGPMLPPGTQFMSHSSSSSYKQCCGHAAYSRAGLRAHCSSLSLCCVKNFSIVTSVQKCTPASCEVPLILQETSPDTLSQKLCEKSRASLEASPKYMQQWKRFLYCTQLCHRQGCHILLCSREAFVCWSRGEFIGGRKKLAAISCGHTTVPGMMYSRAATGHRVTAGCSPIWPKDISLSLCSQVFELLILIIHSSRPEWWLCTHPDVSIHRCAWNSDWR